MRRRISLYQVCDYFKFDIDLVRELAEFGLYPIVDLDGDKGVEPRYLDRLWEAVSLHEALGINKEGIDVILELRSRVSSLQETVAALARDNDRLRLLLGDDDLRSPDPAGLVIDIFEDA